MANYNHENPANYGIPCPTSTAYTYVASGVANDDKVATITFKNSAGATIGVLTFAYVGATNNVSSVTRTT